MVVILFRLLDNVITHILKIIGHDKMINGILYILFGSFLAGSTTGAIITKKIQKNKNKHKAKYFYLFSLM